LIAAISQRWEKSHLKGREIALLTDGQLRRPLRQVIERSIPDLTVTSYAEIPTDLTVDVQDIIRLEEVEGPPSEPLKSSADGSDPGTTWRAATAAA
jgi:flagellar biosynthesis protein FlhA